MTRVENRRDHQSGCRGADDLTTERDSTQACGWYLDDFAAVTHPLVGALLK